MQREVENFVPDGSAIQNVNLVECSSHEQVAPPFRGENGLHHVATAFRSFRQAEIWVAGQLVLDPKIKSLPLVKVPSEPECHGNWTGNFRDKIVRRVKKHGICYLFSEATPAFCMPETGAISRIIGRFCESHHVVILYKNGCQESDFGETGIVQFMPEHLDVPAYDTEEERKRQLEEYKSRIKEIVNPDDLPLIGTEDKSNTIFEALHKRPMYSVWSNSNEFRAVTVTRGDNRSIEKLAVTKFFELHWPEFDGAKVDLKYDPSLYAVVNKLKGRGFDNFISDLHKHLRSLRP